MPLSILMTALPRQLRESGHLRTVELIRTTFEESLRMVPFIGNATVVSLSLREMFQSGWPAPSST